MIGKPFMHKDFRTEVNHLTLGKRGPNISPRLASRKFLQREVFRV